MDMSDAFDPDMTDVFDVVRRAETVVAGTGRSSVPTPQTFAAVSGVVASAGRNDLERLEESDRIGRNIVIVTNFALRGPSKDGATRYKPDLVNWRGSAYVVKSLDPYPQFGAGFVQAICGETAMIGQAT